MSKFKKIIFTDEDNTMLSPFAARLLAAKLLANEMYGIFATSRGIVVLFPEPANQKAAALASKFGIFLDSHKAQQLAEQDLAPDALILTLDTESKTKICEKFAGAANVYTLKEYLGENGDLRLPIGEPVEKYEVVCDSLNRLLDGLISKLKEEE